MESGRLYQHPISISLIGHLLFFVVGIFCLQVWQQVRTQTPAPLIIEVDPIKKQKSRQIVESEKGEKVDEAAPDAFYGKQNRQVKEQQVAALRAQPLLQPTVRFQKRQKAQPTPKEKVPTPRNLQHFGVPIFNPADKHARLRPDEDVMWNDFGKDHQAVHHDYVKGLKKGETTALNTKELVFYSYFERIRRRLNQAWRPLLRKHLIKLYRKGRFPSSEREHTTRTLVTMNKKGEIVRVQVVGESGTRDLDEAAVQAFNKAGPFPNPPKGLIEMNGQFRIRWDFVLRT